MKAKKCDRCGSFYETYASEKREANVLKLVNDNYDTWVSGDKTYDLCPQCMKELKGWLKHEN